MPEKLINQIKENVIQGRVTSDDEGIEEGLAGQPAVTELIEEALDRDIPVSDIIDKGLTASMETVGEKFENEEYYIPDMLASAEAVGAAMELLEPHLAAAARAGWLALVLHAAVDYSWHTPAVLWYAAVLAGLPFVSTGSVAGRGRCASLDVDATTDTTQSPAQRPAPPYTARGPS